MTLKEIYDDVDELKKKLNKEYTKLNKIDDYNEDGSMNEDKMDKKEQLEEIYNLLYSIKRRQNGT